MVLFLTATIFLSNILANSILIEFPQHSKTVLGVSVKSDDFDLMENFAREQASVLFTRLHSSQNYYEYLQIDEYNRKNTRNIVKSIDDLYYNFSKLNLVYTHSYGGYEIFFYDSDVTDVPFITENIDSMIAKDTKVIIQSGSISTAATAEAIKLDEALEIAFDLALTEMSKTTEIVSVTRLESNPFTTFRDILLVSQNDLYDVRLNKVEMKLNNEKNYQTFTVRVVLIKDI